MAKKKVPDVADIGGEGQLEYSCASCGHHFSSIQKKARCPLCGSPGNVEEQRGGT